MDVPVWADRTVATAQVTLSDRYDTLTRVHNLERRVDGRVEEALATDKEAQVKQWLTSLAHVPLCKTSKLDPHREYYVRISATEDAEEERRKFSFEKNSSAFPLGPPW